MSFRISSSGGISIGSTIVSGTPGSVLFIDSGGNLAQDNSHFSWDDVNFILSVVGNISGNQFLSNSSISGTPSASIVSYFPTFVNGEADLWDVVGFGPTDYGTQIAFFQTYQVAANGFSHDVMFGTSVNNAFFPSPNVPTNILMLGVNNQTIQLGSSGVGGVGFGSKGAVLLAPFSAMRYGDTYTFTFPPTGGTDGYPLQTDGSGNTSFGGRTLVAVGPAGTPAIIAQGDIDGGTGLIDPVVWKNPSGVTLGSLGGYANEGFFSLIGDATDAATGGQIGEWVVHDRFRTVFGADTRVCSLQVANNGMTNDDSTPYNLNISQAGYPRAMLINLTQQRIGFNMDSGSPLSTVEVNGGVGIGSFYTSGVGGLVVVNPNDLGVTGNISIGDGTAITTGIYFLNTAGTGNVYITQNGIGDMQFGATIGGTFQFLGDLVDMSANSVTIGTIVGNVNGGGGNLGALGVGTQFGSLFLSGDISFDNISPTARIHLPSGTTSASTSPLKFTSGSLMTSSEIGSVEFLTDDLYFTQTTSTNRHPVAWQDNAIPQQVFS